jgi:hypothetical protein
MARSFKYALLQDEQAMHAECQALIVLYSEMKSHHCMTIVTVVGIAHLWSALGLYNELQQVRSFFVAAIHVKINASVSCYKSRTVYRSSTLDFKWRSISSTLSNPIPIRLSKFSRFTALVCL